MSDDIQPFWYNISMRETEGWMDRHRAMPQQIPLLLFTHTHTHTHTHAIYKCQYMSLGLNQSFCFHRIAYSQKHNYFGRILSVPTRRVPQLNRSVLSNILLFIKGTCNIEVAYNKCIADNEQTMLPSAHLHCLSCVIHKTLCWRK